MSERITLNDNAAATVQQCAVACSRLGRLDAYSADVVCVIRDYYNVHKFISL